MLKLWRYQELGDISTRQVGHGYAKTSTTVSTWQSRKHELTL